MSNSHEGAAALAVVLVSLPTWKARIEMIQDIEADTRKDERERLLAELKARGTTMRELISLAVGFL